MPHIALWAPSWWGSQKGGGEAAANSAEKKAIEVNNQDEAEQFKDPSLLNPYETFRGRSGTSNMTTRNSQRQEESERQEDADFSQQSQQQLSQSSQGESAAAAETEAEFKARVEVRLNGNFVEKLKPHQLALCEVACSEVGAAQYVVPAGGDGC